MVYLSADQARELEALSHTRHVTKAELVRCALGRLFDDIKGGQLELPLGVEGVGRWVHKPGLR